MLSELKRMHLRYERVRKMIEHFAYQKKKINEKNALNFTVFHLFRLISTIYTRPDSSIKCKSRQSTRNRNRSNTTKKQIHPSIIIMAIDHAYTKLNLCYAVFNLLRNNEVKQKTMYCNYSCIYESKNKKQQKKIDANFNRNEIKMERKIFAHTKAHNIYMGVNCMHEYESTKNGLIFRLINKVDFNYNIATGWKHEIIVCLVAVVCSCTAISWQNFLCNIFSAFLQLVKHIYPMNAMFCCFAPSFLHMPTRTKKVTQIQISLARGRMH